MLLELELRGYPLVPVRVGELQRLRLKLKLAGVCSAQCTMHDTAGDDRLNRRSVGSVRTRAVPRQLRKSRRENVPDCESATTENLIGIGIG